MDGVQLVSIATIAFLGSFGHCIGMCGGIVIAYSSAKIGDIQKNRATQGLYHLLYSLGRVSTYTLLGAVFGYIGGVATFNNLSNGILLIIAGVTMVLTSLSLLGKIRFLTLIEHSISKTTWYQNNFKSLLQAQTPSSFYLLGILNGLLPCGFVYFFAISAAATADWFWGAMVMLVFGLSTIPALFSLGFFVGFFSSGTFRNTMLKVAAIMVLGYAVFTIYNGISYINNPNKTLTECHSG